ncbi:MAG: DUF3810 domain-containing protein [Candidatus Eremiobacteraeota bacterium]|nr:DUF3810 domain-containing protein [Candidatus Eremiobacteraeota bacterium]
MPTITRGPRSRGPFMFVYVLEGLAIVAGVVAATARPSPEWVERVFSNGYYPQWEQSWGAMVHGLPFALGDLVGLGVVAALVARAVLMIRRVRSERWKPLARFVLDAAAVAGVVALWFYAGWGWGYARAPLETRTAYTQARIGEPATIALRARAMREINRLAPLAHAQASHGIAGAWRVGLFDSWLPVVQRLGDSWRPSVNAAKPSLAGPYLQLSGVSGFINPFTLESSLAPDLLWFELPFSQAHEWSHDAGFNREDEANYIGIISCLRDANPVVQYSGWLELFFYLPPLPKYKQSMFGPLVWQDFAALRQRNARHVNLTLARLSWRVYNHYLTANHVASGIQNYNEVTRLLAGIPLDRDGLPVAKRQ